LNYIFNNRANEIALNLFAFFIKSANCADYKLSNSRTMKIIGAIMATDE